MWWLPLTIRRRPTTNTFEFSYIYFLPNPGRILPVLTFNGCDPLHVNAGRILPGFGRKLRNIGKLDCVWLHREVLKITAHDVGTSGKQQVLERSQWVMPECLKWFRNQKRLGSHCVQFKVVQGFRKRTSFRTVTQEFCFFPTEII